MAELATEPRDDLLRHYHSRSRRSNIYLYRRSEQWTLKLQLLLQQPEWTVVTDHSWHEFTVEGGTIPGS